MDKRRENQLNREEHDSVRKRAISDVMDFKIQNPGVIISDDVDIPYEFLAWLGNRGITLNLEEREDYLLAAADAFKAHRAKPKS